MKNKLRSSWKFISLALALVLVVSMICMSGSAADLFGTAAHQSWGDLPCALPNGIVNFYKVSCRNAIDGTTEDVFLKAVKSQQDELLTYDFYDYDTMHGIDTESSYFDVVISKSYNYADKAESWTVMLKDVPDNPYSGILSVSPLTTTVKSTQTWDGKNAIEYIEVSNQTIVKYSINDGNSDIQEFYVKKEGTSSAARLQFSLDGQTWNDNCIVFENGKTINALILPAYADASPERWIFTVTGYDRLNKNGKLIDYKIEKKNINSPQAWTGGETVQKHTFNGYANYESRSFVYTLKLNDVNGNEYNILQIEKNMTESEVTSLVVKGLDDYTNVYSTIKYADIFMDNMPMQQDFDGNSNSITFNDGSVITLSNIMNSDEGIRVNFNIGRDNGDATLKLQLTESGKLTYDFDGLPADAFVPDMIGSGQDGDSIGVVSYSVAVTSSAIF